MDEKLKSYSFFVKNARNSCVLWESGECLGRPDEGDVTGTYAVTYRCERDHSHVKKNDVFWMSAVAGF